MTDETTLHAAAQGPWKLALDGVWYEHICQPDGNWLLGSVTPGYRQMLPHTSSPDAQELAELAAKGIWLARETASAPKLAVMCCGQGSVWPGMGRELYDSFPEARAAMDRLAACSSWDVLALMDEKDVETIGLTRWQQPYLFMLEYAQWSLYLARGLTPDIICGHSLGELIALCLAGVYRPEEGWYIMETRSRHMADLEAKSRRETGMMGVYAGMDVIRELQDIWPDLYVSNYNTPEQSILSGPRDILAEARRWLRKKRIPAVILNITLAFHNPAMRVLRDLDYLRLMCLDMQAAETPMLSCVTAGLYPEKQTDICRYIMDLDENSVRWLQCVDTLWEKRGIRHFLETGPADTLGGMVEKIRPDALCMSSSLRGHEREQVRRTLAQLHSLGHLRHAFLVQAHGLQESTGFEAEPQVQTDSQPKPRSADTPCGIPALRELLAQACGRRAEELHGSMDLRFDLALRSSFFPGLIEEAQKLLGREVAFEELLKVSTIADLERLFSGDVPEEGEEGGSEPMGRPVHRPFPACCTKDGAVFRELPVYPCRRTLTPSKDLRVLVCGEDDEFCAAMVRTIASWQCTFVLAGALQRTQDLVTAMGARTEAASADLIPAVGTWADPDSLQQFDIILCQGEAACSAAAALPGQGSVAGVCMERTPAREEALRDMVTRAKACGTPLCALLVDSAADIWNPKTGDLLAMLLLQGTKGMVFGKWIEEDAPEGCVLAAQPLHDDADACPLVFPDRAPRLSRTTPFSLFATHISRDIFPSLDALPKDAHGAVSIPLSMHLEAQRTAARLASPWLFVSGMADIRVYAPGLAIPGLVREARIEVDSARWMNHDHVPSRMTHVHTYLRDVSASGRRTPREEEIVESTVIMSGHVQKISPLWPEYAGQTPAGGEDVCSRWYAQHGIGPAFRLLKAVQLREDHLLLASLDAASSLALRGIWAYDNSLFPGEIPGFAHEGTGCMTGLEAVLQAVAILSDMDPATEPCAAYPSLTGLVRFGRADLASPLTVAVRRCWDRDHVVRYDAQVTSAQGECLVSINHLEYNALSAEDGDSSKTPHAAPVPAGE